MGNKLKMLILTIILFVISTIIIIVNGNTYTYEDPFLKDGIVLEDLSISVHNKDVIAIEDVKLVDNKLTIKVRSLNKGKSYIDIKYLGTDVGKSIYFYVHDFGIITFSEYFGVSNGGIIVPISIAIWMICFLFILIIKYKKNVADNLYQYKNITFLGLIIFCIFVVISQILTLFNYNGIADTADQIVNMFSFSVYLFPLVFVVSILVILSNISLIRKEGFNIRNLLGLLLGAFLCFMTILPEILNNVLYSSTIIDIHNQNGIDLYVFNYFISLINIIITYVECILLGTIFLGIKATRTIPKFDKDFIIILGCQVRKDGSLTNLLKGRVDRAIEFGKMQKESSGKEIIFVPSGGKGFDEPTSEGEAMKNYLLSHGISKEKIVSECKSTNTYENILFSNNIIKKLKENANVAFCTTNYHLLRAGSIATEQGIKLEGIGANTKSYFWINAFIREFIASLFYERKKHIGIIMNMMFLTLLVVVFTYLNNNI